MPEASTPTCCRARSDPRTLQRDRLPAEHAAYHRDDPWPPSELIEHREAKVEAAYELVLQRQGEDAGLVGGQARAVSRNRGDCSDAIIESSNASEAGNERWEGHHVLTWLHLRNRCPRVTPPHDVWRAGPAIDDVEPRGRHSSPPNKRVSRRLRQTVTLRAI